MCKYTILGKEISGKLMFYNLRRDVDKEIVHNAILTIDLDTQDFKLEVGMFVRDSDNEINVVTKIDNRIEMFNFNNNIQTYTYEINKFNYEVSNTYDFKEIIYSNIKKELLTEEEKEIVRKWVDAVGREEIESIDFRPYPKEMRTFFLFHTKTDYISTICYKDKFKM